MDFENKWSKQRTDMTRELLVNVPLEYFAMQNAGVQKGCIMQNLNHKFAYFTLEDAVSSRYRFFDLKTDELVVDFGDDVEAVLASDWRISS